MGLRAVQLRRREAGGGGGVYGGDGADLDELAATVGDDARELGADVGGADVCLREPSLELGPLLLKHAEAGLSLVASLFCAFRAAVGFDDGAASSLEEVGP